MALSKNLSLGALGDVMVLLDLSGKQLETKTEDICVIRWSKPSGDYIMIFLPTKIRNVQENGVREAHEVSTRQGGAPSRVGHALHPRGGLVSFRDYFFRPKIVKYSKTEENCH